MLRRRHRQALQLRELPEPRRQAGEVVAVDVQVLEAGHVAQRLRAALQLVVADAEGRERGQAAQAQWQAGQLVAVDAEEGEVDQARDARRELYKGRQGMERVDQCVKRRASAFERVSREAGKEGREVGTQEGRTEGMRLCS